MKRVWVIGILMVWCVTVEAQKNKPVGETEAQKSERFELESLLAEGMKYFTMEEYVRADSVLHQALRINANIAAVNYTLAQILIKREKNDEAAIYAQKAFELTPENKHYGLQLADIYTQQRKFDRAAELYKTIIRQQPDNAVYGLELASVYLLNDKYEEALKAYDEVEKTMGIDEDITHQKQRIYVKLNKLDKAIEEAKKLINSEPQESEYVVQLAQLLLYANRTKEAEDELQKALKMNPDEADARVMLAEIYKKNGDAQGATQQMGQMFTNPNADVDVKMQALVQMLREAKDEAARKEVMSRAEEIVKAHPKEMKAYVVYADLLVKMDRKKEARDTYVKASRLDKSVAEIWIAIAQLDGDLGQMDSLIVHTEQAIEIFPNQGLFWYSNGSAQLVKRRYDKAVESLEEAQKLIPANQDLAKAINAQLGDAYHGTGQHAKSDEAYETVLKDDPNNDHVMNNYSYFLSLRKDKLDRAKALAARVVERNPNNATYMDTYAWVLYVMKDYQGAHDLLAKAVASNSGVSGTIVEHYGDALYQLGEKAKAVEQWKKAQGMGQTGAQIEKKIATGQLIE